MAKITNEVINEISPLLDKDCFYIVERHKSEFTFPIHRHKEFELNFVENGGGAERVVGDSIETISNFDLVLIGGENLEHSWNQGDCRSSSVREITIQFSSEIFSEALLQRTAFNTIGKMLERSQRGISFPLTTIMKVYSTLDTLSSKDGFELYITVLRLFHELSMCNNSKTLSNIAFAKLEQNADSRRVAKIYSYINSNYHNSIRLEHLAEIVNMTPPAFSRFFKLRTGSNLSDYITSIRLGAACRMLIDTTKSISEVSFECGFNNLSNFNRIFKKRKGITPKEFREIYRKKRVIY